MTQTNYKGSHIKLTRVEKVTVAICLIIIGLLLALNHYRARNDYVKPAAFSTAEAEFQAPNADTSSEEDGTAETDNGNIALQDSLLQTPK